MFTLSGEFADEAVGDISREQIGSLNFISEGLTEEQLATEISDNPAWLLDAQHYNTASVMARRFNVLDTHALLLCTAVVGAQDRVFAMEVTSETEELYKKLFRLSYHLLTRLSDIFVTHNSGGGFANQSERNKKVVKKRDVIPIIVQSTKLWEGLVRAIENSQFLGGDSDEIQTMGELYIGLSSRFYLEITPYAENLSSAIVVAVCAGVKYQRQQETLQNRLVRALTTTGSAAKMAVLIVQGLMEDEDTRLAAIQITRAFFNAPIPDVTSKQDEAAKGAQDDHSRSLTEFMTESSKCLPRLIIETRTSMQELLTLDLLPVRTAAITAMLAAVAHIMDRTGPHLQDNPFTAEDDELVNELIAPVLRHTYDSSHRVRHTCLRGVSDLYKFHHSYFNRANAQALQAQLIQTAQSRLRDKTVPVRAQAFDLFCKIMLDNQFVNNPLVPQAIPHLNSDIFGKQLATINAQIEERFGDIDFANEAASEEEVARQNQAAALNLQAHWLEDAVRFAITVDEVIEWAKKLLNSAKATDLNALIGLFTHADSLNVKAASDGLLQLLQIVWLKQGSTAASAAPGGPPLARAGAAAQPEEVQQEKDQVTKKLLEMYDFAWFTADPSMSAEQRGEFTAVKLIQVVNNAAESQILSLEQLFLLYKEKALVAKDSDRAVHLKRQQVWQLLADTLWNFYQKDDIAVNTRRSIAILLSMLAKVDAAYADQGEAAIVDGLNRRPLDYVVLLHTCRTMQQMTSPPAAALKRLKQLLWLPAKTLEWFGFAHEGVQALAQFGDVDVLTELLHGYGEQIAGSTESDVPEASKQLLFAQMIYVASDSILILMLELEKANLLFKQLLVDKVKEWEASRQDKDQQEDAADGVQLKQQTEFEFGNLLATVTKRDILYDDSSIFAVLSEQIMRVCRQILGTEVKRQQKDASFGGVDRFSPFMQVAAISALCKFSCANEEFCSHAIPMLLALLDKSTDDKLRSTLVVALGDIAASFNHVMEQHTPQLFDRLQDPNSSVQRTSVVILTFLILGGKVKVRGNLGFMALLLVHHDVKIKNLAHTFYREYAQKDNDYVNAFLDIMSSVIGAETQLQGDQLKEVVTFLTKLFHKKTDVITILRKMVPRLRRCEKQRDWDVYSLCCTRLLNGTDPTAREKRRLELETAIPELKDVLAQGFIRTRREWAQDEEDPGYNEDVEGTNNPATPKRQRPLRRSPDAVASDSESD